MHYQIQSQHTVYISFYDGIVYKLNLKYIRVIRASTDTVYKVT